MNPDRIDVLMRRAFEHYQKSDYNAALKITMEVLRYHPDNYRALYASALSLRGLENHGLALLPARRCVELAPNSAEAWNSLGMSFSAVGDLDTAEECFRRSIELDGGSALNINNLGDAMMQRFEPQKALDLFTKARTLKGAEKIIELLDENEGHCRLGLRQWSIGWKLYEKGIGRTRNRRPIAYPGASSWDGNRVNALVLYGEQGVGDEIMFASCIPDALKFADTVHIDTQKKLKGLFARSFPTAIVHGTRVDETRPWTVGQTYDASCIFGSLPKFFRNQDRDFPGTPYLKADPERRAMVRTLLDGIRRVNPRRPKIGIAWSGGMMTTGRVWRSLDPDTVLGIIEQFPDVDWVSLEYDTPGAALPIRVRHFPYLTQTNDYDDTAALVAELDAVVTVQTAVVHLAGALGVPCFVLVSNRPIWRYGSEGDSMNWYKSVKLFRQPREADWSQPIAALITHLKEFIAHGAYHRGVSPTAA